MAIPVPVLSRCEVQREQRAAVRTAPKDPIRARNLGQACRRAHRKRRVQPQFTPEHAAPQHEHVARRLRGSGASPRDVTGEVGPIVDHLLEVEIAEPPAGAIGHDVLGAVRGHRVSIPEVIPPNADAPVAVREGWVDVGGIAAGRVPEVEVVPYLVGQRGRTRLANAHPAGQPAPSPDEPVYACRDPVVVAGAAFGCAQRVELVQQPVLAVLGGKVQRGRVDGVREHVEFGEWKGVPQQPQVRAVPVDPARPRQNRGVGLGGLHHGNQRQPHRGHRHHLQGIAAFLRETRPALRAERQLPFGIHLHDHPHAGPDHLRRDHSVVRQLQVALIRLRRDLVGVAGHDHAVNLVASRPGKHRDDLGLEEPSRLLGGYERPEQRVPVGHQTHAPGRRLHRLREIDRRQRDRDLLRVVADRARGLRDGGQPGLEVRRRRRAQAGVFVVQRLQPLQPPKTEGQRALQPGIPANTQLGQLRKTGDRTRKRTGQFVPREIDHSQLTQVADFRCERAGEPVVGQRQAHHASGLGPDAIPAADIRIAAPGAPVVPRLAAGQFMKLGQRKPLEPAGIARLAGAARNGLQPFLKLVVHLRAQAGVGEPQHLQILEVHQATRKQPG